MRFQINFQSIVPSTSSAIMGFALVLGPSSFSTANEFSNDEISQPDSAEVALDDDEEDEDDDKRESKKEDRDRRGKGKHSEKGKKKHHPPKASREEGKRHSADHDRHEKDSRANRKAPQSKHAHQVAMPPVHSMTPRRGSPLPFPALPNNMPMVVHSQGFKNTGI